MLRWYFAAVCMCMSVVAFPQPAGAQTFSNPSSIAIPSSGPASLYPSNITVAGLAAPVAKVTVTLTGFSHTYPADVDVLLVAPNGERLVLLSDAGANHDASNLTITLGDMAPSLAPSKIALQSGTYRPTDYVASGDPFTAPAPAVAAGDRAVPIGDASFASRFAGISGNGTWKLYVVDDAGNDSGAISGGWSLSFSPLTTATAGQLIISEFRYRGQFMDKDEYIEIYNASGAGHVVSALSGTGYGVAASDGVTRCSIPNGTFIPAGGHFLCVNSAYSLASYPAGPGPTTGDASYTTDIPNSVGIAIFNNNTGGGSYSLANRLDAVGTVSEANTIYKEGYGLVPLYNTGGQYAFMRRPAGGCVGGEWDINNCVSVLANQTMTPISTTAPADTNKNEKDFIVANHFASDMGSGGRLGAPGPENLSSPVTRSGTPNLRHQKFDSCAGLEQAPNVVRDFTPDADAAFGTLEIRRQFTNDTGSDITHLRFRIVDLTSVGAEAGVADLRARSSTNLTTFVDDAPCGNGPTTVLLRGTTLEGPIHPLGGGYNSSLAVLAPPSSGYFPHGSAIGVRFVLGVMQFGVARFCVVPEALPDAIGEPFCYIGSSDGGVIYTPGDFDKDRRADVPLYNSVTGAWTVLKSGGGAFTSSSIVNLGGAGYTPMPGDYDGDNRLDAAVYQEATGQWSVLTSSSNFAGGFTIQWGGPGYRALPGDYDGDGQSDLALYRAPTGLWAILLSSTGYTNTLSTGWGGPAFTPVGGLDFDADGKADPTIYNEATGTWSVLKSAANYTTMLTKSWGGVGYTLVPGDYDGDGKADFGVYSRRTGVWSVLKSSLAYTTTLSVTFGAPGYVPMPADYDGDGRTDAGLRRLQTNAFTALTSSSGYGSAISRTFGTADDVPISAAVLPRSSREIDAGDFDGDFTSDLTVYNKTSGMWSILTSSSGFMAPSDNSWGGSGYTPVPGDYDADGRMDLGIYDGSAGVWSVLLSASNYTTTFSKSAGGAGYVPVPGDYDGDGKIDLVVYHTTTGQWFGLKSSTNYTTTVSASWGGVGYTAVPGDYDADGKIDLGLYQESTGDWSILTSSSNYMSAIVRNFGGVGYVPVQADHDGDGITDFAVYQTASGVWSMLRSASGNTLGFTVSYGGPAYRPVAGDWDGDGRADVGVYTAAGTWSILLSSGNYTTSLVRSLGGASDVPLPAFQ